MTYSEVFLFLSHQKEIDSKIFGEHNYANHAKAQVASLLCSKEDVIEAHIMDVKLQVLQFVFLAVISYCIIYNFQISGRYI